MLVGNTNQAAFHSARRKNAARCGSKVASAPSGEPRAKVCSSLLYVRLGSGRKQSAVIAAAERKTESDA